MKETTAATVANTNTSSSEHQAKDLWTASTMTHRTQGSRQSSFYHFYLFVFALAYWHSIKYGEFSLLSNENSVIMFNSWTLIGFYFSADMGDSKWKSLYEWAARMPEAM